MTANTEGKDLCAWCGENKHSYLPICFNCREMQRHAKRARDMVLMHTGRMPIGFEAAAICSNCGPLGFLNAREDGCQDCYARRYAWLCSRSGGLKTLAMRASLYDVNELLKDDP